MKLFFALLACLLLSPWKLAQGQTISPAPSTPPSMLLPENPFTTVTTRFTCAEGQTLEISAKVPPRTLAVEFDDRRGIVAQSSESGSASGASTYDPLAATIASERISGRGNRDFSDLRVGGTTTSVSKVDYEARHWAQVESNRRAENRDRLLKAESRNAPTRKLTREELRDQREAFDDMLDNLSRTQPISIKHKFHNYSLLLERTYTGPKFVNRSQGIEWSVRNRLGTLRSSFSGRTIAFNCRQGSSQEKAADLPALVSLPQ